MVFSSLTSSDKDAFFALLDEYFSSRPDLVPKSGTASPANGLSSSTGRAVQNALSNTTPQQAAAVLSGGWKRPTPDASASKPDDTATPRLSVFAAAAAYNAASGGPRPPPRRYGSSSSSLEQQPAEPPESEVHKLVSTKKFGDVDLSSAKNTYTSLRNSTANKTATPPAVAPPTPAAFGARKGNFAPPPVRRVNSTASIASTTGARAVPAPPPRPPQEVQEEEEAGEWAEVLYDYSSEDPGDLQITTGQQVYVIERSSDDWWTAELDGRKGLVPASYVKLL